LRLNTMFQVEKGKNYGQPDRMWTENKMDILMTIENQKRKRKWLTSGEGKKR